MQRIQDITGYPLDRTQSQALEVIVNQYDLLATLPTGSGKTVIALTAIIINAFDKGQRAILTTPVKALSNQKYAEFERWFTKIGFPNRITLLTGDIQSRATPTGGDGGPELLIMTSEILANKLGREIDPDLVNVSVLVMDEAHYINDTERGHVWERTIMHLPQTIQIVALSATLSEPERFQEWLSKRRPTQLVQRHDRHVPLHFGFYDTKGFVELYNTRQEHKTLDSNLYKRLLPQNGTFSQAVNKIVKILEKDQKLPTIIFSMSKMKCEEAAYCLNQNFLYGSKPVMGKDDDPLAFGEILSEHSYNVTTIRNRQDALFQKYLHPYKDILKTLPGFEGFKSLLDKGIAYHHAGMIPILREYVEILFSEKLLKVVFATETLAIGINMPAKSVVFTSLEKPGGNGEMVSLRPEQFMQMSGRAGRRGMDDKGFVVYYPVRNVATDSEFRQLLFGKMPAAISQLSIDPLFVLKSLVYDDAILSKSLLYHQQTSYINTLTQELNKLPCVNDDDMKKMTVYLDLQDRLKPGLIRVTNTQRKMYDREMAELGLSKEVIKVASERITIEKEINSKKTQLDKEWEHSLNWLKEYNFLDYETSKPTMTGKIASGLSDGKPLVRAVLIEDIKNKNITFEQFAGWLGCFTESLRLTEDMYVEDKEINGMLEDTDRADERFQSLYEYNSYSDKIDYNTGLLIYLWAQHKDINQICGYIGSGQLGTFIKAVLRVISYMEEMKKVLLGLQYYELYNCLDHHQDRLMNGMVSNRSLYVEM